MKIIRITGLALLLSLSSMATFSHADAGQHTPNDLYATEDEDPNTMADPSIPTMKYDAEHPAPADTGPHAIATIFTCKFKNGRTVNVMKNDTNYDYYFESAKRTEATVHATEQQIRQNFLNSGGDITQEIHFLRGGYTYVVSGWYENGKLAGSLNVLFAGKNIASMPCVDGTATGRIMDHSLFENAPYTD
jgi:hypothetical protein